MNKKTPRGERFHIGFFGKTNSGKSSLLNSLTEQKVSIVSDIAGTTTDAVEKRFELLGAAPVIFIDTAGFGDYSELGSQREKASLKILQKTDLALIIISADDLDMEWAKFMVKLCKTYSVPFKFIFSKSDLFSEETKSEYQQHYPEAEFLSIYDDLESFKYTLSDYITAQDQKKQLLGDILSYGMRVLLVVPIDSEAPKGRIIHPQVQVIRECLDHGVEVIVTRDTELTLALERLNNQVDLVITDSQAFDFVAQTIPKTMPLTSFSIVFARYKGELDYFTKGINSLKTLQSTDKICIAESCSHNISCEDIGRFKIPKALEKILGFTPQIDFMMGNDFPTSPKDYQLIIHCGACMTNQKEVLSRIQVAKDHQIPMLNYGVFLAYCANILPRAIQIFQEAD